jgi:hypothetical protein
MVIQSTYLVKQYQLSQIGGFMKHMFCLKYKICKNSKIFYL